MAYYSLNSTCLPLSSTTISWDFKSELNKGDSIKELLHNLFVTLGVMYFLSGLPFSERLIYPIPLEILISIMTDGFVNSSSTLQLKFCNKSVFGIKESFST